MAACYTKNGRGVTLTPHPLLVPWSWKGRATPLVPLWAVRPVQSLSACTMVHFTLFYLLIKEILFRNHTDTLFLFPITHRFHDYFFGFKLLQSFLLRWSRILLCIQTDQRNPFSESYWCIVSFSKYSPFPWLFLWIQTVTKFSSSMIPYPSLHPNWSKNSLPFLN